MLNLWLFTIEWGKNKFFTFKQKNKQMFAKLLIKSFLFDIMILRNSFLMMNVCKNIGLKFIRH